MADRAKPKRRVIDGISSFKPVTPDDDNDLPDGVCEGVLVVESGDLEVVAANDDPVTGEVLFPVVAGQYWKIRARRIKEATDAVVKAAY